MKANLGPLLQPGKMGFFQNKKRDKNVPFWAVINELRNILFGSLFTAKTWQSFVPRMVWALITI